MKGYQVVVEECCSDHYNFIVSEVVHTDLKSAIREFKNTIIDLSPDEDLLSESTERLVSFADDEGYQLNIYIHEVEIR